jgi:hypothetical protein
MIEIKVGEPFFFKDKQHKYLLIEESDIKQKAMLLG